MTLRTYEIKVGGLLGNEWGDWFDGLSMARRANVESGIGETIIRGSIDQAQLHAILSRIRDLNMTVISVNLISGKDGG